MANILLVEDSPVDSHLVKSLLEKSGWSVDHAADGQLAVDYLKTNPLPEVIVTDMVMPNMDGLELVRRVRKTHAGLPIVLITNYGSEAIAIEALRIGATNYSPKTSLSQDLTSTVRRVIEMARHMQYTHDSCMMPVPGQVSFVLENDLTLIGPLIEMLQEKLPSWSDRDRLQLGMAIDEALTNAMHHGNLEVDSSLKDGDDSLYYGTVQERRLKSPYRDRRVHFQAEFTDEHICVQISDEGPGFDPTIIPDPRDEENLMKLSGRGLLLIRSFMDQVAHNQAGNQITMTKLRPKDAESLIGGS